MSRVPTWVGCCTCAALAVAVASPCAAEGDGAYGRIDGDLAWQIDLGAGLRNGSPGASLSASTRYLDTAGLYVSGFLPWSEHRDRPRTASCGVELRPLFLPRFLKNLEHGPPLLDLTLDSTALRLGALVSSSHDASFRTPGWEAALQLGAPLTSSASGPWLRFGAALQWSHASLAGSPARGAASLWTVALAWQGLLDAGLVDLDDRSAR